MHTYLIETLECPVCHGELEWSMFEQNGDRIEIAEAHCQTCSTIYRVRDGIGLFLTPNSGGGRFFAAAQGDIFLWLLN